MPGGTYDLLVVDDQAGVRYLLHEVLVEEGYRVDVASSGKDALIKAAAGNYVLILMDFKMPGINGLDALQALRKIVPETPVVIMTASDENKVLNEAEKRGVQHCLLKPFDLDEVRHLVKRLLLRRKVKPEAVSAEGF